MVPRLGGALSLVTHFFGYNFPLVVSPVHLNNISQASTGKWRRTHTWADDRDGGAFLSLFD